MRKFCITGVPGTGKSSVVEELNKKGIKAFDIDAMEELCHWKDGLSGERVEYRPGIGKEWLDHHDYFCNVAKLKDVLDECDCNVVVAGIATNQDEFIGLFDKVILLHCDEENFIQRLNTRPNHDFARDKSEQEHILGYYKEFEADMLKSGAVPINTEASLEVVVNNVISELKVV